MKRWISSTVVLGVLPALLLVAPVLSEAAAFLKIGSIAGESTDKDHNGWIDVVSHSSGFVASTMTASTRSGVTGHQAITITKMVDKASPLLAQFVIEGNSIGTVEMEFVDVGDTGSTTFVMKDVLVTSVQAMGGMESVTFTCSSVSWVKTGLAPASSGSIPGVMPTLMPAK